MIRRCWTNNKKIVKNDYYNNAVQVRALVLVYSIIVILLIELGIYPTSCLFETSTNNYNSLVVQGRSSRIITSSSTTRYGCTNRPFLLMCKQRQQHEQQKILSLLLLSWSPNRPNQPRLSFVEIRGGAVEVQDDDDDDDDDVYNDDDDDDNNNNNNDDELDDTNEAEVEQDENDEEEEEKSDVSQPQQQQQQQHRRQSNGQINLPRHQAERRLQGKKKKSSSSSVLSKVASSTVSVTSKVAQMTVTTSGKVAYTLLQPKHIERNEIYGLWRIDQQIIIVQESIPSSSSSTIISIVSLLEKNESPTWNLQITPNFIAIQSMAPSTDDDDNNDYNTEQLAAPTTRQQRRSNNNTKQRPYQFKSAQWPRGAKLEFVRVVELATTTNKKQQQQQQSTKKLSQKQSNPLPPPPPIFLLYKADIQRKIAASNVIKLKGKIYLLPSRSGRKQAKSSLSWFGWGSTPSNDKPILIGTFIGRRRIQLSSTDSEEDNGNDDNEEDDDNDEGANDDGDDEVIINEEGDSDNNDDDNILDEEIDNEDNVNNDEEEEEEEG